MALLQPPSYCESEVCYTPQQDRLLWGSIVCQDGIQRGLVVADGTGLSVTITTGSAFIQGETQANEGLYWVTTTADENRILAPADPTDPRIDLVIASINSDCTWTLEVITGTPAPVPVRPAAPLSSLTLAVVTIPAGSTGDNLIINTTDPDVRRAKLCADMTPEVGWVTISTGNGTPPASGTGVIPVPAGALFVRGSARYTFSDDVDLVLRLNGHAGGTDFRSSYREWDSEGDLISAVSFEASSMRVGNGRANRTTIAEFQVSATAEGKQMDGRWSSSGPTVNTMTSGLSEGVLLSSVDSNPLTSIQLFKVGAVDFLRLLWVIEAYIPS